MKFEKNAPIIALSIILFSYGIAMLISESYAETSHQVIIPLGVSSHTTITMTNVGNTEIDLDWEQKDRMVRSWTEFTKFNPNDGYFQMKIIQQETSKVVSESTIQVMSTSVKHEINFNSLVLYMVNLQDICQNEDYEDTMSVQECNPLTGLYEMEISTRDGLVIDSITFTILDFDSGL